MPYCNENKRFFAGVQTNFSLMIFKQKDEYFCRIKPKQDIVQTVTNFLLLSAENATKNSK